MKSERQNTATTARKAVLVMLVLVSTVTHISIPTATAAASSSSSSSSYSPIDWINNYLYEPHSSSSSSSSSSTKKNLSMMEITELRVRDIKRRLALRHGYSAAELANIPDKRELINILAFEEHKEQQRAQENRKRSALKRSIMIGCLGAVVVAFWPLIRHVWDVARVNFVVYIDRKKYETGRCFELRSTLGCSGIFLMFALDLLQLWLSASVILSWFVSSGEYLFPIPHVPIRPAALLAGGAGAGAGGAGPLGRYGINVGPMIITWLLRFVHGRVETWTGRVLSKARERQRMERKEARRKERKMKKKDRANGDDDDDGGDKEWTREARRAARAARKAEKEAKRREAVAAEAAAAAMAMQGASQGRTESEMELHSEVLRTTGESEEAEETGEATDEGLPTEGTEKIFPTSFDGDPVIGTGFDDLD